MLATIAAINWLARASVEAAVHTISAAVSGARPAPSSAVVPLVLFDDTIGEAHARSIGLTDNGELVFLEGTWRARATALPHPRSHIVVLLVGPDGRGQARFVDRSDQRTTIRGLLVIRGSDEAFLLVRADNKRD